MEDDQKSVITELYKRRDSLPPDKQAVIDELYKRMGASASPPPSGSEPSTAKPGVLSRMWGAAKEYLPSPPAADWPELGPQFRQQIDVFCPAQIMLTSHTTITAIGDFSRLCAEVIPDRWATTITRHSAFDLKR
jgi:hypothetical protein